MQARQQRDPLGRGRRRAEASGASSASDDITKALQRGGASGGADMAPCSSGDADGCVQVRAVRGVRLDPRRFSSASNAACGVGVQESLFPRMASCLHG